MALRPALHWTALAVVLGLALVPAASAQPRLESTSRLRADVPATREASTIEIVVDFTLPQDSQGYLKVSPVPGNPVFGNGTAGGAGWWTEATLYGPLGDVLKHGMMAGDPPLQFGDLAKNTTFSLHLVAHAPAGALAAERDLALDYILAEHVASTREGSGGTLDESVGLHAIVRVQGEAGAASPEGPTMPLWALLALAGASVLVAAGIVAVALRRSRDRDPLRPER